MLVSNQNASREHSTLAQCLISLLNVVEPQALLWRTITSSKRKGLEESV